MGRRGRGQLAVAVGQQQDDTRSTRRVRAPATRPSSLFKLRALLSHQDQCRWHAPSYPLQVESTKRYCYRDALAMVRLVETLEGLARVAP